MSERVEYYLGVTRRDSPEVEGSIWIDADEYEKLRSACNEVIQFVQEQTYSLVVRNYVAFDAVARDARGRLSRRDGIQQNWQAIYHGLQLALLDWLLASRLFLDHARYELTNRFGKDSEAVSQFDRARRHEHSHRFSYRLMYDLRDYCAHRGMPPVDLNVSGDVRGARHFEMTLDPSAYWHGVNGTREHAEISRE